MRILAVISLFVFLVTFVDTVIAQQGPRYDPTNGTMSPGDITRSKPSEGQTTSPSSGGTQSPAGERTWTSIEIVLSVAILVFGALVFALQTFLMVKLKLDWTPNSLLRFNGLTLIIVAGILLVTAGYSDQQMAPVIGLLGTIAGYLLGSGDKPRKDS